MEKQAIYQEKIQGLVTIMYKELSKLNKLKKKEPTHKKTGKRSEETVHKRFLDDR